MTSLRDEFTDLLAKWSAAICRDDDAAISEYAGPDWVIVADTGVTTRDRFLAAVASGDLTHEAMRHTVHDARRYGDVAVIVARVVNNGAYRGQPFQFDEWSTDVFVKRGAGWKCVLTQLTAATAVADEQPADEQPADE